MLYRPIMKYWLALLILCCGCGGTFILTPIGHREFYKSKNGEFSCYSNNCCWPYKKQVMICSEAALDNVSVSVKIVPGNK